MHYLDESHIFWFLVQVGLLLGLSRSLGLVFRRYGQPAITAEIIVGVCLGPTILGRFAPGLHGIIFPADAVVANMLQTVAWLGIFFFLLQTGLETDFSTAWRQRREAAVISLTDLTLPLALAFVAALMLPESYHGAESGRVMFALFIGTIMTISALPVTARILQELNLYRSDTGLLTMCALTINDLAGWLIFAVILGFATGAGMGLGSIAFILVATIAFTAFCLTVGKTLTDRAIRRMHAAGLPEPGASLTFVCLLGLIGGAITLKLGIHALFGFFIAGIMAGESKALSENTRHVIGENVRAVMVPLFFASVGLKVDFLQEFDFLLVAFVLGIGTAGRFLGAWVGVTWSGTRRSTRHLISAAHVPGGEMQIVIGVLALEYRVIAGPVFVAIVTGSVVTSMVVGPWMKWALARGRKIAVLQFFSSKGVIADLEAGDRREAIRELGTLAARLLGRADAEGVVGAVLERESIMGTALDHGTAVPHARLDGLRQPLVVLGRSVAGIDWNSPDGLPTHFVFLVLNPPVEEVAQVTILRAVGSMMTDESVRQSMTAAASDEDLWQAMQAPLAAQGQAVSEF